MRIRIKTDLDRPPLLLHSARKLGPGVAARLRDAMGDPATALAAVTVIEELDVYQLVDGRWEPLKPHGEPPTQETLEAEGVTAGGD